MGIKVKEEKKNYNKPKENQEDQIPKKKNSN